MSANNNPDNTQARRVFKTAWFSKAARKAHILDRELCEAIRQVMHGQADDLGGGVFKKRLHGNLQRSIILAKAGRYWVYEYLFAKQKCAGQGIRWIDRASGRTVVARQGLDGDLS